MSEEIMMTNVAEVVDDTNIAEAYEILEATESKGSVKVAAVVTTALIAAGAAVWHFSKDWREARQIKNLEKKGYVVSKVEENHEPEEVDVTFTVLEEEETEE